MKIDSMTREEIDSLILELKQQGYLQDPKYEFKKSAIYEALRKRGAKKPYVSNNISKPIYSLADYFTNNYYISEKKKCSVKTLPEDAAKRKEYYEIVDGIIGAIYKYYDNSDYSDLILGFCEKLDRNNK